MPPTKRISSSKKKKKLSKNNSKGNGSKSITPPDLNEVISQADIALETSDVDTALKLYTYASSNLRKELQERTENITTSEEEREATILSLSKVLGKMAEIKVSIGDHDGGRKDFTEATNLLNGEAVSNNPISKAQWKEARANLYLYLGQLTSCTDALNAFQSAIGDLKNCILLLDSVHQDSGMEQDHHVENALVETKRQLCGAYCSVAELYLTDLCYEPNAESACEEALELALQLDDPKSPPDALQAMANLRLSQKRNEEAVNLVLNAYDRVREGCEAMADLVGLSNKETEEMNDIDGEAKELQGDALEAANSLPGFEFRCQMAKLLLECASLVDTIESFDDGKKKEQQNTCIEASIQVLGSLLAENDEVIEIWFLLGCAFTSTVPKNSQSARYYFENSLEMLLKVKKIMEQDDNEDEEAIASLNEIDEKIKEVQEKLELLGDDDEDMNED
jgi:tetratricopeptide (TPR) repeat protein